MKKTTTQKFIDACHEVPLDFKKLNQLIDEGADINGNGSFGTVTEDIVLDYPAESSDHLPKLIDFLIKKGFDTHKHGLETIGSLVFSTADKNSFYAAKHILCNGVSGDEKAFEHTLETIGTEESYQRCCDHDPARENLYYTMYEAVKTVKDGGNPGSIDMYHTAIGMKVEKIIYFHTRNDCFELPTGTGYNADIGLVYNNKVLLLTSQVNILFRNDDLNTRKYIECDDLFGIPVTDSKIIDITFANRELYKGKTGYDQQLITLHFDTGNKITFTHDFGEHYGHSFQSRFEIS